MSIPSYQAIRFLKTLTQITFSVITNIHYIIFMKRKTWKWKDVDQGKV